MIDRFLGMHDRKIGPEEQFVPDIPLGHRPEGVVVGPRAVEIRGKIGIHVRMLANHDAAIDLPRVPDVGHDDAQVRECGRDPVHVPGMREVEIGKLDW